MIQILNIYFEFMHRFYCIYLRIDSNEQSTNTFVSPLDHYCIRPTSSRGNYKTPGLTKKAAEKL